MEFWEIAFEGVGVGEFKEMLQQWVERARTRMDCGESVPCLCVFKEEEEEEGVYKMKSRLVTVELLRETETFLLQQSEDPPKQLVFLGQNVKLMSTIFKADLGVHVQDMLHSVVLDVSKRIESDGCTARDDQDLTWFIQAGDDNLYVATRYCDMFACVCSEPAWKVIERGQMVKQEYADWIESHIDFVKEVKFTTCLLLTSSAREHQNVTVRVHTDIDVVIQASMTELYFLGTRYIITRKYKALQVANKRRREPEADIIAATKVLIAAARKYTATDDSLTSELEACKRRLAEVTQDRDRLKGIFEKLSSFTERKNKMN
jgi:hypothetical protein